MHHAAFVGGEPPREVVQGGIHRRLRPGSLVLHHVRLYSGGDYPCADRLREKKKVSGRARSPSRGSPAGLLRRRRSVLGFPVLHAVASQEEGSRLRTFSCPPAGRPSARPVRGFSWENPLCSKPRGFPAHGEDVAQGVRRRDLSPGAGVVRHGGDEVHVRFRPAPDLSSRGGVLAEPQDVMIRSWDGSGRSLSTFSRSAGPIFAAHPLVVESSVSLISAPPPQFMMQAPPSGRPPFSGPRPRW